jgi:hypothetical protein
MVTTNRAGGLGAPVIEEGEGRCAAAHPCPEALPERAPLECLLEAQQFRELRAEQGVVDNSDASTTGGDVEQCPGMPVAQTMRGLQLLAGVGIRHLLV